MDSGMPWPVMWKKPEVVQAVWIWVATAWRAWREGEKEGAMLIMGMVKGLLLLCCGGFPEVALLVVRRVFKYCWADWRASV